MCYCQGQPEFSWTSSSCHLCVIAITGKLRCLLEGSKIFNGKLHGKILRRRFSLYCYSRTQPSYTHPWLCKVMVIFAWALRLRVVIKILFITLFQNYYEFCPIFWTITFHINRFIALTAQYYFISFIIKNLKTCEKLLTITKAHDITKSRKKPTISRQEAFPSQLFNWASTQISALCRSPLSSQISWSVLLGIIEKSACRNRRTDRTREISKLIQ